MSLSLILKTFFLKCLRTLNCQLICRTKALKNMNANSSAGQNRLCPSQPLSLSLITTENWKEWKSNCLRTLKSKTSKWIGERSWNLKNNQYSRAFWGSPPFYCLPLNQRELKLQNCPGGVDSKKPLFLDRRWGKGTQVSWTVWGNWNYISGRAV